MLVFQKRKNIDKDKQANFHSVLKLSEHHLTETIYNKFHKNPTLSWKNFYLNKFNSCLGNKRQVLKLLNDLSGNVMNSSNVPVLKTVANIISQPKDQDNAIAFNNYFANVGFEISKHLGAEN